MNRDNAMIMEAMHRRPEQIITSELHKVHNILNDMSTMIHLNRSSETDQLLSKIRDLTEMLMQDAPAEDAEHMDGISRTRNALGRHIMHMANYGIPTREEFIKIRHELHHFTRQIEDRGTAATEEEKRKGRHMIAQLRAYRSSNADDPGSYADDPDGTASAAEDAEHRSNAQHAAIAIALQKAGKKPA